MVVANFKRRNWKMSSFYIFLIFFIIGFGKIHTYRDVQINYEPIKLNTSAQTKGIIPDQEFNSFRVAFGSCADQFQSPTIFNSIKKLYPQIFIWLGDAIYLDKIPGSYLFYKEKISHYFNLQKAAPEYQSFLSSSPKPKIIGVWDDHDAGGDNCTGENPLMEFTKAHFLDFLGEPEDTERRLRSRGVHTDHHYEITFDSESASPRAFYLSFLLLDVRSFATLKGPAGNLLGEEQWAWLEKRLASLKSILLQGEKKEHLVVVGSGIEILSHGVYLPGYEYWAMFGDSRSRLVKLLEKYALDYLLISGDVHFGEISCLRGSSLGYDLIEMTSSGLTHEHSALIKPFLDRNFFNMGEKRYKSLNFGMIEISGNGKGFEVNINVRDIEGEKRVEHVLAFGRREVGASERREFERSLKKVETCWEVKWAYFNQHLVILFHLVDFVTIEILRKLLGSRFEGLISFLDINLMFLTLFISIISIILGSFIALRFLKNLIVRCLKFPFKIFKRR